MPKSISQKLQEARNVGEWLESRLHLMFTQIADEMFGDGKLARDERITLSSAIGSALDAFRAKIESAAPQLYERPPWKEPASEMDESGESLDGGFVELVERAVRQDGTIPVRLIQPGWGSSGYYSADVLERDGPKVFPAGTQMFWNHATFSEEMERPEGDLNGLAAVLTTGARYQEDGVAGPGLYADAKVFERFQDAVNDMGPYIGVSIRALGTSTEGEAEGRSGVLIQSIEHGRSVDFVTKPGAGGQILEMFEAARNGSYQQFRESGKLGNSEEDSGMPTEAQFNELKEAMDAQGTRVAALETSLSESQTENARLRTVLTVREAQDFALEVLAGGNLPLISQRRLAERLATDPPLNDDGTLDRDEMRYLVAQEATEEEAYLAQAMGTGRISGMGVVSESDADRAASEAALKQMTESFQALGLSADAAKIAANGRG